MTTDLPRINADMETARLHLLAEIHAEQQVQTEWLHRIRDLLAVMAGPKGTHDRIGSRCTQVGCLELHDPEPTSAPVAGDEGEQAPEDGQGAERAADGRVWVDRADLHYAVTVLDALDPFLDPDNERWLTRLRAALDGQS